MNTTKPRVLPGMNVTHTNRMNTSITRGVNTGNSSSIKSNNNKKLKERHSDSIKRQQKIPQNMVPGYCLLGCIGGGSGGNVWKAINVQTKESLAVKIIFISDQECGIPEHVVSEFITTAGDITSSLLPIFDVIVLDYPNIIDRHSSSQTKKNKSQTFVGSKRLRNPVVFDINNTTSGDGGDSSVSLQQTITDSSLKNDVIMTDIPSDQQLDREKQYLEDNDNKRENQQLDREKQYLEDKKEYFGTEKNGFCIALLMPEMLCNLRTLILSFREKHPKSMMQESFIKYITRSVCTSVLDLNHRGYIHGDIKPENILIQKDGTIRLADFGLCRQKNYESSEHPEFWAAGNLTVVTAAYRPPECWLIPEFLTPLLDMWSIGCIVLEMFTNTLVFASESIGKIFMMMFSLLGIPDFDKWRSDGNKYDEKLFEIMVKKAMSLNPQNFKNKTPQDRRCWSDNRYNPEFLGSFRSDPRRHHSIFTKQYPNHPITTESSLYSSRLSTNQYQYHQQEQQYQYHQQEQQYYYHQQHTVKQHSTHLLYKHQSYEQQTRHSASVPQMSSSATHYGQQTNEDLKKVGGDISQMGVEQTESAGYKRRNEFPKENHMVYHSTTNIHVFQTLLQRYPKATEFILGLLAFHPNDRMTSQQSVHHSWLIDDISMVNPDKVKSSFAQMVISVISGGKRQKTAPSNFTEQPFIEGECLSEIEAAIPAYYEPFPEVHLSSVNGTRSGSQQKRPIIVKSEIISVANRVSQYDSIETSNFPANVPSFRKGPLQ